MPVVWRAGEETQWRSVEPPAHSSPRRAAGRSLQPPVPFRGCSESHASKQGWNGWPGCGDRDRRSAGFKGKSGAGKDHRESSISLWGQTPVPDAFLGEGTKRCWSPPLPPRVGRDGPVPRKEQHAGNDLCLWFHLGASNLLAQLIGTVNLQLQLPRTQDWRWVLKSFLSPLLVAITGPGARRQGQRQTLSLSRLFLPSWWLVKLVPHGIFPAAHGANHTEIPKWILQCSLALPSLRWDEWWDGDAVC